VDPHPKYCGKVRKKLQLLLHACSRVLEKVRKKVRIPPYTCATVHEKVRKKLRKMPYEEEKLKTLLRTNFYGKFSN
jgi:hypothetical protein